jgi:hypothetical protein
VGNIPTDAGEYDDEPDNGSGARDNCGERRERVLIGAQEAEDLPQRCQRFERCLRVFAGSLRS